MQIESSQLKETDENKNDPNTTKRLTPTDYAKAGIRKLYDWSVKDREAHDREMEKYRQYLMKLCSMSHEVAGTTCKEDAE